MSTPSTTCGSAEPQPPFGGQSLQLGEISQIRMLAAPLAGLRASFEVAHQVIHVSGEHGAQGHGSFRPTSL